MFPAAFTIQKAKQFILQELQELAVHAPARSMRWQDDNSERLVLQLAGQTCHHPAAVALAPGIREMLNPRERAEAGSPQELPGRRAASNLIVNRAGSGGRRRNGSSAISVFAT